MVQSVQCAKRARPHNIAFIVPAVHSSSVRNSSFCGESLLPLRCNLFDHSKDRGANSRRPITRPRQNASMRTPQLNMAPILNAFRKALFATVASVFIFVPQNASAKPSVITITDQVPNFSLPSQEKALVRDNSRPSILVKTLNVAKKVGPVIVVGAGSVWALNAIYNRSQQKRLREFQDQLSSVSPDVFTSNTDADQDSKIENKSTQKSIYYARKHESKIETQPDAKSSDISPNVLLDIFQERNEKEVDLPEQVATATSEKVIDATPTSAFERAILVYASQDFSKDEKAEMNALEAVVKAREESGLSESLATSVVEAYVSRVISAKLDRSITNLYADEAKSLQNMCEAIDLQHSAMAIDKGATINYIGLSRGKEKEKEELYKRYAVHCFTNEANVGADFLKLQKLQELLKIDQERTEAILAEVSQVMFQAAVNASASDGKANGIDMESLKDFRESFGKVMDQGSSESDTSEVALMRMMYALQMILQQEGSLKDLEGFKKICQDLGVDMDEVMSKFGDLEKAMGADSSQFVDELKDIVKAAAEGSPEEGSGEKTRIQTDS